MSTGAAREFTELLHCHIDTYIGRIIFIYFYKYVTSHKIDQVIIGVGIPNLDYSL